MEASYELCGPDGPLRVGARVKGFYPERLGGDDAWHYGTVTDVFPEQKVATVRWDNGDKLTLEGAYLFAADSAQTELTKPSISLEFEPVEECMEAFNEAALNMLQLAENQAVDLNPLTLGMQVLSVQPLVWVERTINDYGLRHTYGLLVDRRFHSSDESWQVASSQCSKMATISRLRRIALLGPVSDSTRRVLQQLTERLGGIAYPIAVVRTRQPAWLTRLMLTGELVACHSLAANSAASRALTPGQTIRYSVRDHRGGAVVPVAGPFVYDVLATFGDRMGRAIAVAPRADSSSLYLCFRGVRRDADGDEGGAARDREAMLRSSMVGAAWLAALAAAEGGGATPPRVHSGTLAHHESVYGRGCPGVGLREWLASYAAEAAPRRLVFVGFSFGGALAQLTALRVAADFPSLRGGVHALALGPTQWASAEVARLYGAALGARGATLVTAMEAEDGACAVGRCAWTERGGGLLPPPLPTGGGEAEGRGEEEAEAEAEAEAGGGGGEAAGCDVVVDPMTRSPNMRTSALPNVLLCEVAHSPPAEARRGALLAADGRRVALPDGWERRAPHAALLQWKAEGGGEAAAEAEWGVERAEAEAEAEAEVEALHSLTRASALHGALDEVGRGVRLPAALLRRVCAAYMPPAEAEGAAKRKRSAEELEAYVRAVRRYWKGDLPADDPFAVDCERLHRGESYRGALLREHWRLMGFADVVGGLPLAMCVEGAWECRADARQLNVPSRASFERWMRSEAVEPAGRRRLESRDQPAVVARAAPAEEADSDEDALAAFGF